jgi:hypothetical protein
MKKVALKEKTASELIYEYQPEEIDQEFLINQKNDENTFDLNEQKNIHPDYYARSFFLTYRDNHTTLNLDTIIDQLRRKNTNMITYTASEEVDPDLQGVHFHVLLQFKNRIRVPKDSKKFELTKFHVTVKKKENNQETVVKPCYLKSILQKQVEQVIQYIIKQDNYISNDTTINQLEYTLFLKRISDQIQNTKINEEDSLKIAKTSLGIEHYERKLSRLEKFIKKELKQRENIGNMRNNHDDDDVYQDGWQEENPVYIKVKDFLKSKLHKKKGNAFIIIGQSNVGKTQFALNLVRTLGMNYVHTSSVNAISKQDQTLIKAEKVDVIIFDDCIQIKELNVNQLSALLSKKTSNMNVKYGSLEFSQNIKKIILSSPNTTNEIFMPEPNKFRNVFSNEIFDVEQVIEHMKDNKYYEILNRLIENDQVNIVVVNEPLYDKDFDYDKNNNVNIDIDIVNININTQNIFELSLHEQDEEFKKVYTRLQNEQNEQKKNIIQ